MITRIEIATANEFVDPRGEEVAHRVRSHLGIPIEGVRSCEVYHIEADLSADEAERAASVAVLPAAASNSTGTTCRWPPTP